MTLYMAYGFEMNRREKMRKKTLAGWEEIKRVNKFNYDKLLRAAAWKDMATHGLV